MKEKLINAPILRYPNFKLPFQVEIDACLDGLGAVLSQEQREKTVVIALMHPEVYIRMRKF